MSLNQVGVAVGITVSVGCVGLEARAPDGDAYRGTFLIRRLAYRGTSLQGYLAHETTCLQGYLAIGVPRSFTLNPEP